jgi:hypothetical protein
MYYKYVHRSTVVDLPARGVSAIVHGFGDKQQQMTPAPTTDYCSWRMLPPCPRWGNRPRHTPTTTSAPRGPTGPIAS